MRKFLCLTTAISFAATAAMAAVPRHFADANLLPLANVSSAKARSTALAARPGQITDQELEKERGGTGLRYSFDVKSHGKTFEVGIDARTGKVLENDAEGADAD
jgi:uncharacterized membrane protein YkoI